MWWAPPIYWNLTEVKDPFSLLLLVPPSFLSGQKFPPRVSLSELRDTTQPCGNHLSPSICYRLDRTALIQGHRDGQMDRRLGALSESSFQGFNPPAVHSGAAECGGEMRWEKVASPNSSVEGRGGVEGVLLSPYGAVSYSLENSQTNTLRLEKWLNAYELLLLWRTRV